MNTVDGWNPAPPRMMSIPLFIGFYTSQVVVWDFFHQQHFSRFHPAPPGLPMTSYPSLPSPPAAPTERMVIEQPQPPRGSQKKSRRQQLHPRKLTWNLKIWPWKRRNIYKPPIFGFHVSFQGGKFNIAPENYIAIPKGNTSSNHPFVRGELLVFRGCKQRPKKQTLPLWASKWQPPELWSLFLAYFGSPNTFTCSDGLINMGWNTTQVVFQDDL